jgi:DNA-directed RNA polymerase specialized sigma24 family protein
MEYPIIDELATRARDTGSEADFVALLEALRPYIRGLSRQWDWDILRDRDREDLEQEYAMVAHDILQKWDPSRLPYKHYFCMACDRLSLTIMKSNSNKKSSPLNSSISMDNRVFPGEEDGHEVPAPEQGPSRPELDDMAMLADRLFAMLLTDIEARAMRDWAGGHTITDTAATLGIKYKVVDNALDRARKKLAVVAEKMRSDVAPELALEEYLRDMGGHGLEGMGYVALRLRGGTHPTHPYARISPADAHWVAGFPWHVICTRGGDLPYTRRAGGASGTSLLSRMVARSMGLVPPDDRRSLVGHLNGDRMDCRRENLYLRKRMRPGRRKGQI